MTRRTVADDSRVFIHDFPDGSGRGEDNDSGVDDLQRVNIAILTGHLRQPARDRRSARWFPKKYQADILEPWVDSREVKEIAKDWNCRWAWRKERFPPSPSQQFEDWPEDGDANKESREHHSKGAWQPKERGICSVLKYERGTDILIQNVSRICLAPSIFGTEAPKFPQ